MKTEITAIILLIIIGMLADWVASKRIR